MDGMLEKPVTLPALLDALARWAWPSIPERMVHPVVAPAPSAGCDPVLADDRLAELRGNLPAHRLGEMAEECLADLNARLPSLRRVLASGDADDVLTQAHAMLGMAAGYGMAALAVRLRAIMEAARRGDNKAAAALAVLLDADLDRAAAALRGTLAIPAVRPDPAPQATGAPARPRRAAGVVAP